MKHNWLPENEGGRYWLFGGADYYPKGGMEDFRFSFATVDGLRGPRLTGAPARESVRKTPYKENSHNDKHFRYRVMTIRKC